MFKLLKVFLMCAILFFSGGFSNILYGQQKTVSGTVYDEKGEALPGVSIVMKGTTLGTISMPNGSFSVSVPQVENPL